MKIRKTGAHSTRCLLTVATCAVTAVVLFACQQPAGLENLNFSNEPLMPDTHSTPAQSSGVDMAALDAIQLTGREANTAHAQGGGLTGCWFPRQGRYMDWVVFPQHRTRQQMDTEVEQAYDQWKSLYLLEEQEISPVGGPLYRVTFGKNKRDQTVSEGQGYGMLLATLMAGYEPRAQQIFNGLWYYSKAHPSLTDARFMAWIVPEPEGGTSAAFDAEIDMAYALILADALWGSQGMVNYRTEALIKINGILETMIGPNSHLPMLGDWVDPWGAEYNQYSVRSSDLVAFYFRVFERYTGNPAWHAVAAASTDALTAFQSTVTPTTGLFADFLRVDSTGGVAQAEAFFLEGEYDNAYYYNAGRTPWRIGLDALLNGDAQSKAQLAKLGGFVQSQTDGWDPDKLRAGYTLDGAVIGDYFTSFFAAPFAVSLMSNPQARALLEHFYSALYKRSEDYYEDSINLLSLLLMTGNVWDPTVSGCQQR